MKAVLFVDEQVQGYRKEYEDISTLREDVNALIDEKVIGIKIIKRAPIKGVTIKGNPGPDEKGNPGEKGFLY